MPSASPRQHRFMEMVAHDPEAASRAGVSQQVGRDFVTADTRASHRGKPGFTGRKHKRSA